MRVNHAFHVNVNADIQSMSLKIVFKNIYFKVSVLH